MRGFLRIVFFAVVGPFIGLLAMAVLIGTYTLATTGSTRDFTLGPELFSPGILIASYSIGLIPALLAGIASIFVKRASSGWPYRLWMALIGGGVSLAGMYVLVGGGPEILGVGGQGPLVILVALSGAVAAFVCATLLDGQRAILSRPKPT